ncbi:hypothetical protein [Streptomyces caniscabiei]|uniref:hypothetical protein n=1 Tax=Streptomyces caniscabiei TaxID=2746961 RepID=UPI000765ED62|nr:hypothetical protein [Streptomyces caniscabiei]
MTGVHVCSLITGEEQAIPVGGYHIVRFPFGGGESYDAHGMHQMAQPDGYQITNWRTDDRAGLIWPAVAGWGVLTGIVYWDDGSYSELRDRFERDPLGLSTGSDTTATDHRPRSPGAQCFTKGHQMFVHPGTPIAFKVGHNSGSPQRIYLAEFKLAIHPVEEGA